MAYEMRRRRQELAQDEAWALLREGTEGVLSLVDAQGAPYGVPLNYVVCEREVLFHSAVEGRKVEALSRCGRASFCVIGAADVIPEKLTTAYRSVIAEGRVREVKDPAEKRAALVALGMRFGSGKEFCEQEALAHVSRCVVYALEVERLSGKQGIELIRT